MFHGRRVKSIGMEHLRVGGSDRFILRLHRDAAAIILTDISYICPRIMHLNLSRSIESATPVRASSTIPCRYAELTTLILNTSLDFKAYLALGKMKKLQTLELRRDPRSDGEKLSPLYFITPKSNNFPALRTLLLSEYLMEDFSSFLPIQSRQLESLSLVVGLSSVDSFTELFGKLTTEDFPILHKLSIRNPLPVHHIQRCTLQLTTQLSLRITGIILKPLLSLSSLTTVDINPLTTTFELENADVLMMATSWPALKILSLGHVFGWRRGSHVTLDGLVPLVTYCSDLEILGIVIDATTPPTYLGNNGPINDRIMALHLGDSVSPPIPMPPDTAEFFSALFPALTKIHVCNPDSADGATWGVVEDWVQQLGEFGEIDDGWWDPEVGEI